MVGKGKNDWRTTKTYTEVTDCVTGAKTWVEDKTAQSFGYTTEEFEKLVEDGVIPKELGEIGMLQIETAERRMAASKELLERCQKENRNPTEQDWLAVGGIFNTTSGQLQKEIALHKFILTNKEYLLKVMEDGGRPKRKFRQSAHFVEQKLKYEKPTKKQQPSLFDIINPETSDKIKDETVKYIGIKLTPPEDRLVNSITRLLEKKSQVIEQKADDFYMGNEPYRMVPYGGREHDKNKSAMLRFKKSELLHEFFGEGKYSGQDLKYFERVFSSFLEKKWLIRYKRTIWKKKESDREHFIIEDYLPLIKIIKYFPYLSDEESSSVEKRDKATRAKCGEYILSLNPILTDQIDSKYIEFPEDIDYRTKIAAGSHLSVSDAIIRLRDWLISEMSASRYTVPVNEDTLIHRLHLEKHLRSRKKDRVHSQLTKAIQVCKNLGIILDMEEGKGAIGQKKFIFKLNKDF